ncbi:BatA domain-containing protein [Pseudomonadota bacterium]
MMGISWISPMYVFGLALIVVPVLIHLVQRERHTGFKFPSLMFLKKIPYKEKRRLKIRNWWLLILRCILLSLIILTFSRPYFSDSSISTVLDLARNDSVIVIDRSYSMRMSDHWQQAQELALDLVNKKKAEDRIGIVVFDSQPEILSDLSANANSLRTAIKRLSPGLRTTQLGVAIEQAEGLLRNSDASNKQIQLISDFQATGATSGRLPHLPKTISLKALPVSSASSANTTISSVSVSPTVDDENDKFGLKIQLTNQPPESFNQQIILNINGRNTAKRILQLGSESVMDEHFDRISAAGDITRGIVSLTDDALLLDNQVFFVHSSKHQIPVLILEGEQPRLNQNLYLENALKRSRKPIFRVQRLSMSGLKPEELFNWAVIIINDTSIPGGPLGQSLHKFVSSGGGLLVATGDAVSGHWPSGDTEILPGKLLRRVSTKAGKALSILELNSNHPLTEMLNGRDINDLSNAHIFAYRNIQPNPTDRIVGRYTDGGVALLERLVGDGRVLVLTTTLDKHWTDFPVQPMFLPLLHQIMRYLAEFEMPPNQFEVGAVVDVLRYARAIAGGDAVVAGAHGSTLIVESPSGSEIRLSRNNPLLRLEEQGFYQVHGATPGNLDVVLAANINSVEANLRTLDVGKFVEDIVSEIRVESADVVPTKRQKSERELDKDIWRILLLLVFLLLLLEAFSANLLSRRTVV